MQPDTVYQRVGDVGPPALPMPEFAPPPPKLIDDAILFPSREGLGNRSPSLMDVFALGRPCTNARYNVDGGSNGSYSGSSVNIYAAW